MYLLQSIQQNKMSFYDVKVFNNLMKLCRMFILALDDEKVLLPVLELPVK